MDQALIIIIKNAILLWRVLFRQDD